MQVPGCNKLNRENGKVDELVICKQWPFFCEAMVYWYRVVHLTCSLNSFEHFHTNL